VKAAREGGSIDEPGDFASELLDSGGETHVHELGLRVHLQSSLDGGVHSELELELLVFVLGVGLEGSEDLVLLGGGELLGRDNGDLLLLVEGLVELGVLGGNEVQVGESLVLGEDLDELDGEGVEIGKRLQSLVELLDFLGANACVLRELLERLRVLVQLLEVGEVLVDRVQSLLLRGGREEHSGVPALNSVVLGGGLVVGGRLNLLHVSNVEASEEGLVDLLLGLSLGGR